MLRVGLGRPQSIGEVTMPHQREDEARRFELEAVAEQWQQVRMVALLQHVHLTLKTCKVVLRARVDALYNKWQVTQPRWQRLRWQRGQRVGKEDAAVAAPADEPLLTKATCCCRELRERKSNGRIWQQCAPNRAPLSAPVPRVRGAAGRLK